MSGKLEEFGRSLSICTWGPVFENNKEDEDHAMAVSNWEVDGGYVQELPMQNTVIFPLPTAEDKTALMTHKA